MLSNAPYCNIYPFPKLHQKNPCTTLFWQVQGHLQTAHTHTRLTALCPGLPGWVGTRKVKPVWILLKQETVSGSGISWAICKSAPRSRQITTPAPYHSVFTGWMPFLPPNQQHQSNEGKTFTNSSDYVTILTPPPSQSVTDEFLNSVLWRYWLGGRKGIRPVKNWVVGCSSEVQTCIRPSWCHCQSLYLASIKSRLILPFWYRLTRVVPDKGPFQRCVCFLIQRKIHDQAVNYALKNSDQQGFQWSR